MSEIPTFSKQTAAVLQIYMCDNVGLSDDLKVEKNEQFFCNLHVIKILTVIVNMSTNKKIYNFYHIYIYKICVS